MTLDGLLVLPDTALPPGWYRARAAHAYVARCELKRFGVDSIPIWAVAIDVSPETFAKLRAAFAADEPDTALHGGHAA
jgi:hypothetical protein